MTKREAEEVAEATRQFAERWRTMSAADRALRLQAAGILDATGELAPRYRSSPIEVPSRAAAATRGAR